MRMRGYISGTLAAACVAAGCAQGARATQASDLRVMGIRTNSFEFTLMSSMSGAGGERLAFNHISGSTHMVRVGERLGAYTVESYTAAVERVLNPTLNAYQERRTGTAVLRDGAGRQRVLKMGEVLPDTGWSACVVALDSGAWRYVQPGDALALDGGTARVAYVTEREVGIRTAAGEQTLEPISESERKTVGDRWAGEERRRRAALAAAAQPSVAEEEVLPLYSRPEPPVPEWPPRPPRRGIGFGAEFSYPIEFEVVPIQTIAPDGTVRMVPVALPTRFQRRSTGIFLSR